MAATKTRNENLVPGDTALLDLIVYNSNALADVNSVNQVSIYMLDQSAVGPGNPEGRVLITTTSSIDHLDTGKYEISLYLDPTLYLPGNYLDVWNVSFDVGDVPQDVEQGFLIYTSLWATSPIEIAYDASFYFSPNRFRYGAKQNMTIEVDFNLPRASDLATYYYDMIATGTLKIYMSSSCCNVCNDCDDLLIDGVVAPIQDVNRGFYFFDTTQFDCGIYDIWFSLDFGASTFMGPKSQVLIYD